MREKERRREKVGKILLISSCCFPFLYLTMAPLFLPHSICLSAGLLSFDRGI